MMQQGGSWTGQPPFSLVISITTQLSRTSTLQVHQHSFKGDYVWCNRMDKVDSVNSGW